MIYKNAEIHNIEEIFDNGDGSISWKRVPSNVYDELEADCGQRLARSSTGVEIRFKMNSDKVILKMAVDENEGCFHVYRGSIQGSWDDHEVHKFVSTKPEEFEISRSPRPDLLKAMNEKIQSPWNCDVIRIIFDRGNYKLYDIIGDIEPPAKEDCPQKTLMCYGSSITHGSNSIDMSHSWSYVLAHNINYDIRNKGMAGSCCMEPSFADYIAAEGAKNNWDVLTLELGINVLGWEEDKIYERVTGIIEKTATANPNKPIFVISPFYHCGDDFDENDRAHIWRDIISEVTEKLNFPNVVYINGLDLLGETENISADFVHPNIHGVAQIAHRLTEIVKKYI